MRRRLVVALGVLSLLVLALLRLGGGGSVPLYDGICTSTPYQSLGGNPPPSSASKTFQLNPDFPTEELATAESVPQAQVILAEGSFAGAAGSTVTVSITPVSPPPTRPADGVIAGNVYDVEATGAGGAALALTSGHPATVALAVPPDAKVPVAVERYDSGHWTQLKTFASGCGTTSEAASPLLGRFALVSIGSGGSGQTGQGGAPSQGGGVPGFVIAVLVVVVVLVLLVGGTRLSRRR